MMAQWANLLAAKSNILSSVPKIHKVEGDY